ncbi:hypothetical protein OH491_03310 [Termitidicoccus mucosus]|uniref:hypothetical protein n=1 Tax=Termitidicoccus mucosus TaxID=1184151 RepID=UPI003183FC57
MTGKTFSAAFDRATGFLASLKTGEIELLAAPLAPHYWRAPVDNDRGNNMADPGKPVPGRPSARGPGAWRTATDSWKLAALETTTAPDGAVTLTATGRLNPSTARKPSPDRLPGRRHPCPPQTLRRP